MSYICHFLRVSWVDRLYSSSESLRRWSWTSFPYNIVSFNLQVIEDIFLVGGIWLFNNIYFSSYSWPDYYTTIQFLLIISLLTCFYFSFPLGPLPSSIYHLQSSPFPGTTSYLPYIRPTHTHESYFDNTIQESCQWRMCRNSYYWHSTIL